MEWWLAGAVVVFSALIWFLVKAVEYMRLCELHEIAFNLGMDDDRPTSPSVYPKLRSDDRCVSGGGRVVRHGAPVVRAG